MAIDPERFDYERRVNELTRAYRDAQRILIGRLRNDLRDAEDLNARRRRQHFTRQLNAILQLLDQLGHETDPTAQDLIAQALRESATRTRDAIIGAGVRIPAVEDGAFNGVARHAIEALQRSLLGRLADARQTVGRRVEDIYAAAGRRSTMLALLGADGNRRATTMRLMADLQRQGVHAFVDRAGRQWSLERYAEMAARTITREAVTQGALDRMAAHGVNLARLSSHANPCQVCAPWQGRIFSLDGTTRTYRGESVATLDAMPNGRPPLHPRCRHVLMPVVAAVDDTRDLIGAA